MNTAELPIELRFARPAIVRAAAFVGVGALLAIGLLITARRIAGALTLNLGVAPLVVTLLLAAVIVLGGRAALRRVGVATAKDIELAFAWAGTAAILLTSIGCAWPGADSYAWLLPLPLLVGDHFSRVAFLNARDAGRGIHPRGRSGEAVETGGVAPHARPFEEGEAEATPLQQLTRVRDAEGIESIHGTLHAEFAAGQRHVTLHVGFCPPLEGLPAIEVEVVDGPDATAKVVQAFAHGARFELRLAEPAEDACRVAIEFAASPS
jgi:hypothetical protein